MSVHAGQILLVGGLNILDRVQRAGLGNAKVPVDTVREVGNTKVVDKVPTEPDFNFTLETFDVTTELEAFLQGKVGTGSGPTQGPGATDPDGTEYKWSNCQFVNIQSPWKNSLASGGVISAGHLVPGYYPTKISYKFGIKENAAATAELAGGAFYYAGNAPVEDFFTGDGATTAFLSTRVAVPYRVGGAGGSTFISAFGVIVNGILQTNGVDYVQTPTNTSAPGTVTVTFATAPAASANIRFAYFTNAAVSHPDTEHATAAVKPGSVRGRHICVYLGSGGSLAKVGSVQTFQLDATTTAALERELCNTETVGITINGFDCTGNMVIRARDTAQFLNILSKMTGVSTSEVIGFLNVNPIPLTIQILNPKNPGAVLKTIYVPDAIFQPPSTEVRVNQATDWTAEFDSQSGDFSVFKGAFTP